MFLSSLGVYIRDVGQFIGVVITLLMFLSPIFYQVSALPQGYRPLLYLNPLTVILTESKKVLFWGQNPNWTILFAYSLFSFAALIFGYFWFQKNKEGFCRCHLKYQLA